MPTICPAKTNGFLSAPAANQPVPLARDLTGARPGALPRLETVTSKELADALGRSHRWVLERLAIYRAKPSHPKGIPHLHALGKPYQIRRAVALRLISEEGRA